MTALALQACITLPPISSPSRRGDLTLEVVREAESIWTTEQVLMIPLTGLVNQRGRGGLARQQGMLVRLKDRLDAARESDRIKAVVVRIDSPGGSVTASDLIHHELMAFKEETGLPVVALLGDVAASGGYYVAMAADEIYAVPTCITGSIGVIMALPSLQELGRKIGFEMRVVKSGRHKDSGSMWRRLDTESRVIFQTLIDDYYRRFADIVLDSRAEAGLTSETMAQLADGRVFNAQTALDARFIDAVAYPDAAYDRACEMAGLDDCAVVSYEYPGDVRGHVYAGAPGTPGGGGDVNLLKLDLGGVGDALTEPRFHYLWIP